MKCLFCQKGPAQGVSVYRVNAKGQPGVWACATHVRQTDATVDPVVKGVVEALRPKDARLGNKPGGEG